MKKYLILLKNIFNNSLVKKFFAWSIFSMLLFSPLKGSESEREILDSWTASYTFGFVTKHPEEGRLETNKQALLGGISYGKKGAGFNLSVREVMDDASKHIELSFFKVFDFSNKGHFSVEYFFINEKYDEEKGKEEEISFILSRKNISFLPFLSSVSAECIHSFGSDGQFLILSSALNSWNFQDFTLTPQIDSGFNLGFIEDGSRGLNYLTLSLTLSRPISDSATINFVFGRNWAVNRDRNKSGDKGLRGFSLFETRLNISL